MAANIYNYGRDSSHHFTLPSKELIEKIARKAQRSNMGGAQLPEERALLHGSDPGGIRPWHDPESMVERRRRSKTPAEELGTPIARKEESVASQGKGQGKEEAMQREKEWQERVRLQMNNALARANNDGRLASALQEVSELRKKARGATRQNDADADAGSKCSASIVRRMPTTEAILAITATKRKRGQLKSDAVAKHAKSKEPETDNSQCMQGKDKGKGVAHQAQGKQQGGMLERECEGVQSAKQNSAIRGGLNADMHEKRGGSAIHDLSKRKVVTNMVLPIKVRRTTSQESKKENEAVRRIACSVSQSVKRHVPCTGVLGS